MTDTTIITFAQQKGGTGKTTLAIELACALRQTGRSIAIIDLDLQQTLSRWFALSTYNNNNDKITCIHSTIWQFHDHIQTLKDNGTDTIIVDTPPHQPQDTQSAIKASDLVLVPLLPSMFDIWSSEETFELISKERIPSRFIWNRVLTDSEIDTRFELPSSWSTLNTRVPNHIDFIQALSSGQSTQDMTTPSIAGQIMSKFSNEVLSLLVPEEMELSA
tara:strand:+ start:1755 stop:2408 length:654 start_codon:yes stop_codon:yes gene_type:complete